MGHPLTGPLVPDEEQLQPLLDRVLVDIKFYLDPAWQDGAWGLRRRIRGCRKGVHLSCPGVLAACFMLRTSCLSTQDTPFLLFRNFQKPMAPRDWGLCPQPWDLLRPTKADKSHPSVSQGMRWGDRVHNQTVVLSHPCAPILRMLHLPPVVIPAARPTAKPSLWVLGPMTGGVVDTAHKFHSLTTAHQSQ